MKQSIKLILGGALLLAFPLFLTSCEDILGHWEKPTPAPVTPSSDAEPTMLETPLTLEAAEANATVTFSASSDDDGKTRTFEYSEDGGKTWNTATTSTTGFPITLANIGDKVMFRGANTAYAGMGYYNSISCDKNCYVYGNVMSLINATSFATDDNPTLTAEWTFTCLFYSYPYTGTGIKNHPNTAYTLELPAITLTDKCYANMFSSTCLTTAPKLPAITMKEQCYAGMFMGCKALETAPKLPATTLVKECYANMFNECTNLKEAWVMADYTMSYDECQYMFDDCFNIGAAPTGTLHTASTSSHWAPGTDMPTNWQVKNDY